MKGVGARAAATGDSPRSSILGRGLRSAAAPNEKVQNAGLKLLCLI